MIWNGCQTVLERKYKKNTNYREAIPVKERLTVTLRFFHFNLIRNLLLGF